MRALVYTAPAKLNWNSVPAASPQRRRGNCHRGRWHLWFRHFGLSRAQHLRRPPLVLGHELVGRRRDGPTSRSQSSGQLWTLRRLHSGAQNLCESWKLLGLGTNCGNFCRVCGLTVRTGLRDSRFSYRRAGDPGGAARNIAPHVQDCCAPSLFSLWQSVGLGPWVHWLLPRPAHRSGGMCWPWM